MFETDLYNTILLVGVLSVSNVDLPSKTIVGHLNTETHTLFTINALNQLLLKINNKIDKNYKID